MTEVRPQVNLLKLSLDVSHLPNAIHNISKIPSNTKWSSKCESVCTASFILRESGYVYQLFNKGHINVTKVRRFEDIEKAIDIIYCIIDIPQVIARDYTIDNIQATGRLKVYSRNKSLKYICDALSRMQKEINITKLSFEAERFPGAFIRYQDTKCRATVILFNSRRFVIIGVKTLNDVYKVHDWLQDCISRAIEDCKCQETCQLLALTRM